MRKNSAEFFSEIMKASCECHKGKHCIVVFAIDPNDGEHVAVAQSPWVPESRAERWVHHFTAAAAHRVLKAAGIPLSAIKRRETITGDEAEKRVQASRNNIRQDLH